MSQKLQRRLDADDVIQSVFRSFFDKSDRYVHRRAGDLWRLLAEITVRKCKNQVRYLHADRRDVRREATPAFDPSASAWDTISQEPTASHAAVLTETVERLMHGMEDHERDIVSLSLQGYTAQEIGAELGRAERTVQRVRERVKKRLQRMRAEHTGE